MSRRIAVIGGGYAGLSVARRLTRRGRDVEVTLVDPLGYMTYQPLLPETAAGTVQPGHVVVPLRSAAPQARVLTASLTGLDVERRVATATAADGTRHALPFDDLVLALGSVARTVPVPGLAEHAVGFRTVEEALHLGNRVVSRLELAAATADEEVRRRALTFVFVGGGYAGVEALAELEDMVRRCLPRYAGLRPENLHWVMVEAGDRILGPLPERLAAYATVQLRRRAVDLRTATRVEELSATGVRLSDGTVLATDTVVWTAGVVAHPLLRGLGLPVDLAGRVVVDDHLRVADGVWALGDCAAVPDLVTGGVCPPTAQHAVRQAARLSASLLGSPRPYRHRDAGTVASLGVGKGVAELYGVPVRGRLAWLVHRIYHGSRLPCPRRRVMVTLGWLLCATGHDPVGVPALEAPREPLRAAHAAQLDAKVSNSK